MNLVNLQDRKENDIRDCIDGLLDTIEEYDEVIILAKKKGTTSYTRFSSTLNCVFWWVGCLEAVKRLLMEETCVTNYHE